MIATAVTVTLSPRELYVAGTEALRRQVGHLANGSTPRYGGAPARDLNCQWYGCLGELAYAKHAGRYWVGHDDYTTDVGRVQVRARTRRDYDLILHPEDRDADPVVLALVHDLPRVLLRGWIMAGDGKLAAYWKDPAGGRPAFFVPQQVLLPMDALGRALR